jgi:hypothetical protein
VSARVVRAIGVRVGAGRHAGLVGGDGETVTGERWATATATAIDWKKLVTESEKLGLERANGAALAVFAPDSGLEALRGHDAAIIQRQ